MKCPNCNFDAPLDARYCPQCGALLGEKPPEKLLTPSRSGDVGLGFLTAVGIFALLVLAGKLFDDAGWLIVGTILAILVAPPLTYAALAATRKRYPAFAERIGYGLTVQFVLLLGAVAICFSWFWNPRLN